MAQKNFVETFLIFYVILRSQRVLAFCIRPVNIIENLVTNKDAYRKRIHYCNVQCSFVNGLFPTIILFEYIGGVQLLRIWRKWHMHELRKYCVFSSF